MKKIFLILIILATVLVLHVPCQALTTDQILTDVWDSTTHLLRTAASIATISGTIETRLSYSRLYIKRKTIYPGVTNIVFPTKVNEILGQNIDTSKHCFMRIDAVAADDENSWKLKSNSFFGPLKVSSYVSFYTTDTIEVQVAGSGQ